MRSIESIARDIRANWKNPYFGAVPYIEAMAGLNSIRDPYGYDSGESVVRYFLANAGAWRGDQARAIKAELKSILGGK
jgi:hypothetical protein